MDRHTIDVRDDIDFTGYPYGKLSGPAPRRGLALALSIPEGTAKPTILAATYAVVLFSVIVQGSTLGYVARRTVLTDKSGND